MGVHSPGGPRANHPRGRYCLQMQNTPNRRPAIALFVVVLCVLAGVRMQGLTGHAAGGDDDGGCGGAPPADIDAVDTSDTQALAATAVPKSTIATVTVSATRSTTTGTLLSSLHKGLNVTVLAGTDLQWSADSVGDRGFRDVDTDSSVQALLATLPIGSLRMPGGADANSYDFDQNKSWVSWAIDSEQKYNQDGVDWKDFWSFYSGIGSPTLMLTANAYRSGNPSYGSGDWISANVSGRFAAYIATKGITGALWEAGNETYMGETHLPGLTYPGSVGDDEGYVKRACDVSAAIKGRDASARVGLVVYEWGTENGLDKTLLDNASSECGLSSFDFFIIHDYAPLVPSLSRSTGATPAFTSNGVKKALAFQVLTSTVSDFRDYLTKNYASQVSKPIYITEYGMLFDFWTFDGLYWDSNWHDKGVALLLMRHWLDLVAQGADGAWFWETFSKWFRLVDPAADPRAGAETAAFTLLQELFTMQGRLSAATVSGSSTFNVDGPVGSGCIEGWPTNEDGTVPTAEDLECWHTALEWGGTSTAVDTVQAYVAQPSTILGRKVYVTVMNFGESAQTLRLSLSGFSLAASTAMTRWETTASGWDGSWSTPTTTSSTAAVTTTTTATGSTQTLAAGTLAARSAVVITLTLPSSVAVPILR